MNLAEFNFWCVQLYCVYLMVGLVKICYINTVLFFLVGVGIYTF